MPALNTISIDKLLRLIGTPKCPALIDVRTDEDFAATRPDPGLGAAAHDEASEWAGRLRAAAPRS